MEGLGGVMRMLGPFTIGEEDEDERKRVKRFTQTQAQEMLLNAAEVLAASYTFQPNQFVRQKQGLETGKKKPCGGVYIYLRPGSPPWEPSDLGPGRPLALYEDDCIVGCLDEDGAMAEYFMCTRYLEPAPLPDPATEGDE